ncbi:MAG: dockerin type I repeat-containing protein [Oscillospiraceae bacterium]|nr:dockerin type I repeat-containing protein [Oscillospiraceae bacterium]
MKKLITLLLVVTALGCCTAMPANAQWDEVEVPAELVGNEINDTLIDIRAQLIENVAVHYDTEDAHHAVVVDFWGEHVHYTSYNDTELEEAKQYCLENTIDLNLVIFHDKSEYETYIPEECPKEVKEYPDEETKPVPKVETEIVDILAMYCDVNEDSAFDILDIITVNKAILGKELLTDSQNKAADADGNGTVDSNDSLLLMKYLIGMAEYTVE